MQVGDLVNYVSEPFDGPSVNGVVLGHKVISGPRSVQKKIASHWYQVYWATHSITIWTMEKDLEVVSETR